MPAWELFLLTVIVLGAGAYLVRHYTEARRRRRYSPCAGNCADCPFADLSRDCADPSLREVQIKKR